MLRGAWRLLEKSGEQSIGGGEKGEGEGEATGAVHAAAGIGSEAYTPLSRLVEASHKARIFWATAVGRVIGNVERSVAAYAALAAVSSGPCHGGLS